MTPEPRFSASITHRGCLLRFIRHHFSTYPVARRLRRSAKAVPDDIRTSPGKPTAAYLHHPMLDRRLAWKIVQCFDSFFIDPRIFGMAMQSMEDVDALPMKVEQVPCSIM